MAIISIYSASYCEGKEITEKLKAKTGYELIGEKLIKTTAESFNIPENKLVKTLNGQVSFLNNVTHEREKNIACLRSTLAELVQNDNVIYHGPAAHLLPKDISHILRIGIVANHEYRVKECTKLEGINQTKAEKIIEKDDEIQFKWTQYLYGKSPWHESLYDILIPIHSSSVEQAVSLIIENSRKQALAPTPDSQKALNNFILASRVNIPLVENGYDLDVTADDGNITISLKTYVMRFEHMKEKITKIVELVPGIKNIEVTMGPDVQYPDRYDELGSPPRFLLVDDEKEFVQTLSDRLQTRDLDSVIAYDGEEALSYIEKDEPDVMVLDLKMPGVNGMDVLRKVKKERPHVEVIILTGHGSEKDKATALELGAFAYLEKPVDIEVLSKTMKEAYNKINRLRGEKKPAKK